MDVNFNDAIEYLELYKRWQTPALIYATQEMSIDKIGKCLWIAPDNDDSYAVQTFNITRRGIFKAEEHLPAVINFRARCVKRPNHHDIKVKVVSQHTLVLQTSEETYTAEEVPIRKRLKKIRK